MNRPKSVNIELGDELAKSRRKFQPFEMSADRHFDVSKNLWGGRVFWWSDERFTASSV